MQNENNIKEKRVYGRRFGRALHKGRLEVLETLLPVLQVKPEHMPEDASVAADDIFGAPVNSLHFEIGFGNGEHLLYIMDQYKGAHFIGADPYVNGMSAFLKSLNGEAPKNLRVHMDDALMVINSLKDASVDFLYILNPDPWPKSRHHKRRIVSDENLQKYARVLKDGGMLIQTTDVDELAQWMLEKTQNCIDFKLEAQKPEDLKIAPNGWMATRYENKGRDAGRSQTYLIYKRIARTI